jgi:ABC-type Na+ transport system ATPase subunit NatA
VTGFLGPNGAGKSTTLHLMLGLVRGGGRTLFDSRPYPDLARPMRVVGAVLEAKGFHPRRSARNHLRMLAAAARFSDRRVDQVLDEVGLSSVAHRRAGIGTRVVGELAHQHRLHELASRPASLEAAFLELVGGDVEYLQAGAGRQ